MKKILLLIPDLKLVGGVSNYYNSLDLVNYENIDYFFVNSYKKENFLQKTIRLILNYIKFTIKISTDNYKVVHINPSLDGNSFYRDSIFILISKLFKINTIVFFRGWDDNFEIKIRKSKLKKFLFKISYAKADFYIVLSKIFKSKLIQLGVLKTAPFKIETTVADSSLIQDFNIQDKLNSSNKSWQILFISRIETNKGIYIAIDSFHLLKKHNKNIKLSLKIAGEGGEFIAAQKYVNDNKICDVEFLGNVSGRKKHELLKESKILLFPTFFGEGMPNCVLEAMLYGMPIVSRINAGIPDVVNHEENGFLTESKDPSVFEGFLSLILNNPSLYERICISNHLKASNEFTSEKVRSRIINIYSEF
ncbi:MAG: hypothetical protein CFE21_22540 [Bacteroidetes bacterium B1(2017)]|nr:MAG: hypothetical protein CFE21_22540 [Bacteroidetes bacterium B1(2017)]